MSLRLFCFLLFVTLALRADVIYSNFGTNDSYATGAGMIVTNDGMAWSSVAIQFIPSDNYNLTGVEFVASDIMANDPGISLGIFADNNGEPGGAPLESFHVNGPLGAFGSIVPVTAVTSVLQPLLLTGTPYWVGMQAPVGGLVIWNQNVIGAEGFSSTDGNGNWFASTLDQGVVEIDGTIATAVAASGQSIPQVPEPSAIWLLISGATTVIALRRSERANR